MSSTGGTGTIGGTQAVNKINSIRYTIAQEKDKKNANQPGKKKSYTPGEEVDKIRELKTFYVSNKVITTTPPSSVISAASTVSAYIKDVIHEHTQCYSEPFGCCYPGTICQE